MSACAKALRSRATWVGVLAALATALVMELSGAEEWINRTPAAAAAYHAFGVLLFGAFGLFALFVPIGEDLEMRPIYFRLIGLFCVAGAIFHAVLVVSGLTAASAA